MKALLLALLCLVALPGYARAQRLDSCAGSGNPLWNAIPSASSGPADKMTRIRDVMRLHAIDADNVLTVAVWLGYNNIVEKSLQDKAMVKQYGTQTLYLAASMGRLHDMSLLLKAGVSPDAEGYNRFTAIYGATEHGCLDAIQLLISHGADINHKADVKWTLLEDAVISGQYAAAHFLMRHGYVLRAGERDRIETILTRMGQASKFKAIFGASATVTANR